MAKCLILYYSRRGENYKNGSIVRLAKGNTETVAEYIAAAVGGDLFEIETVKPYARGRSLNNICTALTATTRYLSAGRAGGAHSPAQCSHSSSGWILPAKK